MNKRNKVSLVIIFITAFFFVSCNANFMVDLFASDDFSENLSEAADYTVIKAVYVAVDGNDDSGFGTLEKPYQTINYALSQCSGGETIMLFGGSYQEEVKVDLPNITLRPVDIARDHVRIWNTVDDDEQTFAIWIYVDGSGCKLQSLEIEGGYYYGVKVETMWDWGIPEERYGASNIIIEDCVIHDTGRDCIKITPNCNDITIRRCEIYNSGIGPANINAENAEGIDNVNGDNLLVQECYIHDTYTTGIYFKGGAQNCIVERNIIKNVGFSGILIGFDTSTDYFDLEVNPDYYESIGGIVRNNVIIDAVYAGIGLYSAKDARVYNNTIINTAKEGMSPIYFGLSFQDWDPDAGRPPNTNPEIVNNLVYQDGIDSAMMYIRYADELGGMSSLEGNYRIDNNCYYTNTRLYFEDGRPDSEFYTESFNEWQDHLNCDRNSILEDPKLKEEYKLPSNSPCVDKGEAIRYVSFDVTEKERIEPFDIGAFEY